MEMDYNTLKGIAKVNGIKYVGVKTTVLMETLKNAGLLEKPKKPVQTTKFDYSTLPNGLVEHGRRGVTNAQMIPAIKKALETNNIDGLKILKTNFGQVFESTKKYLNKDYKAKLELLAI